MKINILIIVIILWGFRTFAQTIKPDGITEDSTYINLTLSFNLDESDEYISFCDSLFTCVGNHLIMFAKLADSSKSDSAGHLIPSDNIQEVANPDSWSKYTTTSLLLVKNSQNRILAIDETPVSESGDWYNTYTHYFDENGNTIAFKRYSGFFNGCPGLAKETSFYYFDHDGILVRKDYQLVDRDGINCPGVKKVL